MASASIVINFLSPLLILIFKVIDICVFQVMASVLSADGKQDPDVMAANATSAALMLSDIPWGGPVGVIRIGRIDGKFIVNPTMDEVSPAGFSFIL